MATMETMEGALPDMAMREMPEAGADKPRLQQCVPVAAVSVPDEGEQMAAPEPGDTVRYEVEGKVDHVAGGHVYVDPATINGQPMTEKSAEPVADELAAMQADAGGPGGY